MAFLNGQQIELRMVGGGMNWQKAKGTIGTADVNLIYSKSNGIAVVYVDIPYVSSASHTASNEIILPEELQGNTGVIAGGADLWATGSWQSRIAFSWDSTKQVIKLMGSGASYPSFNIGQMIQGYFILTYDN